MTSLPLAAIVPNWVSNWLTPLWILGVGTLAGLAILFVLWLVAWVLSRIPVFASLAGSPTVRVRSSLVLSFAAFAAFSYFVLWPAYRQASDSLLLGVCLLLPLSLVIGFGVVSYFSPKTVDEAPDAMREGPLGWILSIAIGLGVFGIVGLLVAMDPRGVMVSLTRLPYVGERHLEFKIPATPRAVLDDPGKSPPQIPVAISFRTDELHGLSMRSDQNLSVDIEAQKDIETRRGIEISAGEEFKWSHGTKQIPFPEDRVDQMFVRNYSSNDSVLEVTVNTAPPHPEALTIVLTALIVAGVFLAYLFQRSVMPKVSAVALSTFKSEVNQPLFMIVLLLGLVALVLFVFIPYNTFGEDIKVLKDSGMTLIMVLGIIQAVWASSTSVADEIEGRTALTVLSKPIGRRSFILGKYTGIFWTVVVLFALLGLCLLICVAYKPIYDAREGSEQDPTWQVCHLEMMGIVPGLVLAFLETSVLAAISVAISTRLPMLANFIICFSIYVLGHLTPLVVQSSAGMFEAVRFIAELMATILPNLEHYNIQAAVAAGVAVPSNYLAWALLYSLIYGVIALLLALLLFEDRDLA